MWSSFVPFQVTFSLRSAAGSLRDLDVDGSLYTGSKSYRLELAAGLYLLCRTGS